MFFFIKFSPGEPAAKKRKKRQVVTVTKDHCAKMLKEKKFSAVEYNGRAPFWTTYRMVQTEDKIDTNYVQCRRCGKLDEYNTNKGTKNISAHHLRCNALASCPSMENFVTKEKQITKEEKTALSQSAAEFCFKDLRPFYAIEGPGLLQLLASVSSLSAKYGVLDENQLQKFLPCANTVSNHESMNSNCRFTHTVTSTACFKLGLCFHLKFPELRLDRRNFFPFFLTQFNSDSNVQFDGKFFLLIYLLFLSNSYRSRIIYALSITN